MQDGMAAPERAASAGADALPDMADISCPYARMSAEENPPVSDQVAAAWLRLIAVTELLPPVLDARLQLSGGLTHFEFLVLARLAQAAAGTMRMSALADATNATLPRLSHVVARLIDRGLVERAPCPDDRRGMNAVITAAGRAMLDRTRPAYTYAVNEHFARALSPDDLAALDRASQAILAVLDPSNRLQVRAELDGVQCLSSAATATASFGSG